MITSLGILQPVWRKKTNMNIVKRLKNPEKRTQTHLNRIETSGESVMLYPGTRNQEPGNRTSRSVVQCNGSTSVSHKQPAKAVINLYV